MSEFLNKQIETLHGNANNAISMKSDAPVNDYDMVTIKHITCLTSLNAQHMYLLWCSYTSSYVATFSMDGNITHFDSSYDVNILLNKSHNPLLQFKLFYYDTNGIITVAPPNIFISIVLEFSRYKK